MALVKHTEVPVRGHLHDLSDLRRRMFQLFDEPFSLATFREPIGWMPDVDITETNGDIVVKAELPGMKKDEVDIEIEGNVLTLKGEKKQEKEEKEKEHYLYECSYGAFQRSFTLPTAVNEDQVKAEFQDGVLRVTLPKNGGSRGKKIEIAD
jgi:HSP20 family protein